MSAPIAPLAAFGPPAAARATRSTYRVIAPSELDAGLTQAWQALQQSSEAFASPYFCPQFTRLAGEVRDDVRVLVVESGRRPVAFFPYQRSALGFGRPVAGSLSDYHGVVAMTGSDWCARDLLRAGRLMTWKFDHLVDPSGQFEAYVKALASSPQMDLGGGYERYVRARRDAGSDVVTQTERRARKLAREQGPALFTLHDARPDAWDFLLRWKGAQYRGSGLTDPFAFRWTRAFLRRVGEADGADFAGVLSSLRVRGRVVAAHLGMRSRAVLHWWFPAYDPAYARYSVGTLLLLRLAEAMAHAGIRTIDLGKGEPAYKQRVMTGRVALREGTVERGPWLGRLARARDAGAIAVRRIEQRWLR